MSEFDDWEGYAAAVRAYEAAFGESPPTMEMPHDPAEALIAIREAVSMGRRFVPNVPPDADI